MADINSLSVAKTFLFCLAPSLGVRPLSATSATECGFMVLLHFWNLSCCLEQIFPVMPAVTVVIYVSCTLNFGLTLQPQPF